MNKTDEHNYLRTIPLRLIKRTLSFLLLGGNLRLNKLMANDSHADWVVSILISSFEVEHARGRVQSQLIAYVFLERWTGSFLIAQRFWFIFELWERRWRRH